MRTTALLLTGLCILAGACTGDPVAPADPAEAAFSRQADPPMVPFRLAIRDGTAAGAPGGRCGPFPMITVSIEAVAVGTHFGRSSVRQSHCQNAFDPAGAFTDGEFTDTGADGSSIVGTYDGVLVPTADPARFAIAGTFVITGGSGRYAGATGGGVASGTHDAATGAASLELVGRIASVGSGRSP